MPARYRRFPRFAVYASKDKILRKNHLLSHYFSLFPSVMNLITGGPPQTDIEEQQPDIGENEIDILSDKERTYSKGEQVETIRLATTRKEKSQLIEGIQKAMNSNNFDPFERVLLTKSIDN